NDRNRYPGAPQMTTTQARLALSLLTLGLVLPSTARPQEVQNTSYVAPDGSRVLQHSTVVPATRLQLWEALTTTEGVRSWAVSMVGYRSGEGYDAIYKHFEAGNAYSLRNLYKRFAEGPIEWRHE